MLDSKLTSPDYWENEDDTKEVLDLFCVECGCEVAGDENTICPDCESDNLHTIN